MEDWSVLTAIEEAREHAAGRHSGCTDLTNHKNSYLEKLNVCLFLAMEDDNTTMTNLP